MTVPEIVAETDLAENLTPVLFLPKLTILIPRHGEHESNITY
jgi:hypothetical protein